MISIARHTRPLFRLAFTDGSTLDADASHLWLTQNLLERHRAGDHAGKRTTAEIAESVLTSGRSTVEHNHAIPVAGCLALPNADLPVDPYLLGVWLGDGTSANTSITATLDDAAFYGRHAAAIGYPWKQRRDRNGNAIASIAGSQWHPYDLRARLRKLGVLGNKHIPQAYLRASYRQRLVLLRGLMDTDGTISKDGRVSFAQSNEPFIRQFAELVVSLGWQARLRSRTTTHKDAWTATFRSDANPFALPRKRARWRVPGAQYIRYTRRWVLSVQQVESGNAIHLSTNSASFLAGRAMVPTLAGAFS